MVSVQQPSDYRNEGGMPMNFKYALRMLAKNPGSSIVIVLSLGVLIGTASLMLGVILRLWAEWVPF